MDFPAQGMYFRPMPGFRAEFDPGPGPLAIRVLGYRYDLGAVTGGAGQSDWFCFAFHEGVPIELDGGLQQTSPGSFILHRPGDRIRHGRDGSWSRSWLRFDGEAVATLVLRCGLRPGRLYHLPEPDLHDRWVQAIYDELQHPRGVEPALLRDLVACWWRDVARAARDLPAVPPAIRAARRLIEARFTDPASIRLEHLAAAVGLSRTHLCRGFAAAYGTTPARYAARLRLEQADELLRGSDLSIAAIAERCGFADPYYFSRSYRRRYGISPSRARWCSVR